MKVLAVKHVTDVGLESFESALKERSAKIHTLLSCIEDINEINPADHDVAIILGGPMGVYNADIFPFLTAEIKYIQARLKENRPTLGICLGAQLMAAALGSEVYPGQKGSEIGWHPLTVTEEGKDTPAQHLAGDICPMAHWHSDTFDLPEGATLLATSEKYPQIFQWGESAMAIQSHPEATVHTMERWIAGGGFRSLANIGRDAETLRAETRQQVPAMEKQAALFLNEWLDSVGM